MSKVSHIVDGDSNEHNDTDRFDETELPSQDIDHRHHLANDTCNTKDRKGTYNEILSCKENYDKSEK
jgi:hypothetical protein